MLGQSIFFVFLQEYLTVQEGINHSWKSPDIQQTSWLSESLLAPLGGKDTPKQRRRCGILKSETENDAHAHADDGQRSNGRSAGAREAPWVLHWQLDRTPHVLHHLRDVVVHQHFSISMFVSTSSASPLYSLTTSRLSSSSTTSSF